MKNKLCIILIAISLQNGWAQSDSSGFSLLPLTHKRDFSINPDFACMKLMWTGRKWNNTLGATIPLTKYASKNHDVYLSLSGFINLHDITEKQLMSWQLWRGNLGFDIHFHPYKNLKHHRLTIGLLFHHESQHVTDIYTLTEEFLKSSFVPFDNASARSFEYIGIEAKNEFSMPTLPIKIYMCATARHFSKPILQTAVRQQISAFSAELGIRYKVSKKNNHQLYAHAFFEQVINSFDNRTSPYRKTWRNKPFVYNTFEAGIFFAHITNKNNLSLFVGYNNGNGRGLDFLRNYSEVYTGLRFTL